MAIGGIVLTTIGISLLVGFGWSMFLLHLIFQISPSSNFADLQKSFRGAKKGKYKFLGLITIFMGIFLFFYGSSKF